MNITNITRTHCAYSLLTILIASAVATSNACAQSDKPEAEQPVQFDDLPAPVKLGVRVEQVRRQVPVLSEVVIVPGPAEMVDAISAWSLAARYPVLIDDGSAEARELIGLFVRAYKPDRVLRLSNMAARSLTPAQRKEHALRAIENAWRNQNTVAAETTLGERFATVGFKPVGTVVTSTTSREWASAVALAAGHGQLLVWADLPSTASEPLNAKQALNLFLQIDTGVREVIEADPGLAAMNLSWRTIGDDIDALTLCGGVGTKTLQSANNYLATSDVLCRMLLDQGGTFVPGERWAWGGHIFGTPARSAYDAMCSLFLQPERAWLLDTYPSNAPWGTYKLNSVATQLADVGLAVDLRSPPDADLSGLARTRTIDAGVVFVTSKGPPWNFDLYGSRAPAGRARPGDWPMLKIPCAVYMIHSFSCSNPAVLSTVAGRMRLRGAYAFFGSVQEPTLGAFLPPARVTTRWLAPSPMGAATRFDNGPASKLAMIGDPLITIGPAATRSSGTLTQMNIEGEMVENTAFVLISDELAPMLKERDIAGALRTLVMLGRDSDAAKLSFATIRDEPSWMTPAAADAGLFAAARAGDANLVRECYTRLDTRVREQIAHRDALWLTVGSELVASGRADAATKDLLRANMRSDMLDRDGAVIVRSIRAAQGLAAAKIYADSFRETLQSKGQQSRFDLEMRDALKK